MSSTNRISSKKYMEHERYLFLIAFLLRLLPFYQILQNSFVPKYRDPEICKNYIPLPSQMRTPKQQLLRFIPCSVYCFLLDLSLSSCITQDKKKRKKVEEKTE